MPDYSDYQYLTVERQDDGVAVLTLNRPDKRNAINNDMHTELERVFQQIRALVLTGAGKAFCAGGDARSMEDGSFVPSGPATPFRAVRTLLHNLLEIEQPVVAAVNGDAAGLGANIALYCDIIIASKTARFADTHTRMGLVAGDGSVIIWPLLIGWARAKEYLLTGDWITGAQGQQMGLVNYAVPSDQVMPTAMEWAQRLAAGAPEGYALDKVLDEPHPARPDQPRAGRFDVPGGGDDVQRRPARSGLGVLREAHPPVHRSIGMHHDSHTHH